MVGHKKLFYTFFFRGKERIGIKKSLEKDNSMRKSLPQVAHVNNGIMGINASARL